MRVHRGRFVLLVALWWAVGTLQAGFVPIDISPEANVSWTGFPCDTATVPCPITILAGGANMPKGNWTSSAGAVPLYTPNGANNVWSADAAAGGQLDVGLESITIPIYVYGVSTVYTVINTEWGVSGATYASLTFYGSSGSWTYNLVGGTDVRDYNNAGFTNQASNVTTAEVSGNQRLDLQAIALPASFQNQTLIAMTLQDWGDRNDWRYGPTDPHNSDAGRTFLAAVTVATLPVPEPGTIVLLALGAGIIGLRWRRS
jgi:hypothetical protein